MKDFNYLELTENVDEVENYSDEEKKAFFYGMLYTINCILKGCETSGKTDGVLYKEYTTLRDEIRKLIKGGELDELRNY